MPNQNIINRQIDIKVVALHVRRDGRELGAAEHAGGRGVQIVGAG